MKASAARKAARGASWVLAFAAACAFAGVVGPRPEWLQIGGALCVGVFVSVALERLADAIWGVLR